jgi:hypothetical protein
MADPVSATCSSMSMPQLQLLLEQCTPGLLPLAACELMLASLGGDLTSAEQAGVRQAAAARQESAGTPLDSGGVQTQQQQQQQQQQQGVWGLMAVGREEQHGSDSQASGVAARAATALGAAAAAATGSSKISRRAVKRPAGEVEMHECQQQEGSSKRARTSDQPADRGMSSSGTEPEDTSSDSKRIAGQRVALPENSLSPFIQAAAAQAFREGTAELTGALSAAAAPPAGTGSPHDRAAADAKAARCGAILQGTCVVGIAGHCRLPQLHTNPPSPLASEPEGPEDPSRGPSAAADAAPAAKRQRVMQQAGELPGQMLLRGGSCGAASAGYLCALACLGIDVKSLLLQC